MQAPAQELEQIVQTLLGYFGIPYDELSITAPEQEGPTTVSLFVPEGKILIGKNGQNLKALEHVIRMMWTRRNSQETRSVVVDVNGYRQELAATLASRVHEIARRVQDTGHAEALDPMTSYERRIVHTELTAYNDLMSESVGQDPHRRVVIRPL